MIDKERKFEKSRVKGAYSLNEMEDFYSLF